MAERKITRADGTPVTPSTASLEKKAVKAETAPAAETVAAVKPAAENKKIKKADGSDVTVKPAKESGNATGLRIGAIALWVVAIVFEVLAILILFGKIVAFTAIPTLVQIVIALVLDLICVSVGSTLWKKANRIDPASEKNKVKFWLWNNMGVIVTAFAFIPFVILALTNKNADKKTKTIATVVAIIALLIGGLVSYDWNPVSQEGKDAAIETLADTDVYWSPFGTVYHTSAECSHLNHSDSLVCDSVEKAIENNKTRLCKDCAKRDNIQVDENGAISKSLDGADDADAEFELPVADEDEVELDVAA